MHNVSIPSVSKSVKIGEQLCIENSWYLEEFVKGKKTRAPPFPLLSFPLTKLRQEMVEIKPWSRYRTNGV